MTHFNEEYLINEDAVREILVNAIVHKDYSIKNPIQISVYKDKIYIFNVGHFPSKLHTEVALYKKHSSKPYNPTIANVPQGVPQDVPQNVTDNVTNVSDNREDIDVDAYYEPQKLDLK